LSNILGQRQVRDFLLRAGVWFERAMGLVLIGLAVHIAVTF
jgi:threonine/homoserine/homoserine lactone efflux protein